MATKKKAASSTASAGSSRKSTAKKAPAKKATAKRSPGKKASKKVGKKAGSRSAGAASDLYPDMVVVEREIGGRKLSIETGRMMKLSDGAVVASYGDTVVLAAVNSNKAPEGFDFFPLTVDYREKTSAAGIIPGGFFKREGRPTTKEILACRIIDRSIRPMFPDGFKRDVQVLSQVISSDRENDGDVLAAVASFAALALSSLPHGRTLGMVRIGMVGDELVVNPTWSQLQGGDNKLNLTVAGHEDAIAMVEAGAQEVKEDTILEALELAHDVIRDIVEMVEELVSKAGKPKMDFEPPVVDAKVQKAIEKQFGKALRAAPVTKGPKQVRQAAIKAARDEAKAAFTAPDGLSESEQKAYDKMVGGIIGGIVKQAERDSILKKSTRADGREPDTIRPITIEVGVLPRTHGSTLFTRGETQALGVVTLGGTDDQQIIDGLMPEPRKRFLLHYAFPPFSVGETKRMLAPGRREIGHGALAERGLEPVLPEHEEFPYTIRVTSEVLESNGSSSMATACAGTLAMMDAGVPIKQPVAGIAMGLVMEGKKYAVLSDILGSEDACGDMDFKVVGTGRGITALQMDIKCEGLTREILSEALEQARKGRVHILREMLKVLDTPREKLSDNAPRLVSVQVPPDKIGTIIGPGGKNIRMLQEQYECKISIEDSGLCTITGVVGEKVDACVEYVSQMTAEVELGSVYEGTVSAIKEFGAFVEILPGQEGLVHVSELSNEFIRAVTDVVRIGDKVKVKVIAIDDFGKVKLSRKALLEGGDEGAGDGGDGDGDGGDRGRPRRERGDRDRGDRDRGERRPRRDREEREERPDDERDERPRRGRDRGDREERRPRRDRDDRDDRRDRDDGDSRPPRRPRRSEERFDDERDGRDDRGEREERPRRRRERGDREERGDRDREERRPRRSREDRDDDDRGDREERPSRGRRGRSSERDRDDGGDDRPRRSPRRGERSDGGDDGDDRPRRSPRRSERSDDDGDDRPRRSSRRTERSDDDGDDRPRRSSRRPERSDDEGDERPARRGRSRSRPADDDSDAEERPARGRRSSAGAGGRGRSRDRAMPIEDFDEDDAPRPFAEGGEEVGELESLDSLLADEGEGGRSPRRRPRRSRR